VARAVANSPLVKTALHGGDPNFGRILQAAGMVCPPGPAALVDLEIDGRLVVSAGETAGEAGPFGREVEFALTVPGGSSETEVFFSDLSPDYVRFNSEYTT
jgi:glutamate N-acetyltransferase/amino-acid N-acetyltransferase